MKYLVVGLGNIGPEYLFTRHNIGFMVADRLAAIHDTKFTMNKLAYTAEIKYKGRQIFIIKPTTYMNLSGKAVRYYLEGLKIPIENLLVITDEIQLPYSTMRLKPKGSSGGHNGLKNIEELLQTQNFARLRFGVGNDFPRGRQVDYVLSNFSDDEMAGIVTDLDRASDIVLSFCAVGIEKTMSQFNQ